MQQEKDNSLVVETLESVCNACGATNRGMQTHCLLCHAPLPMARTPQQPQPSQPAGIITLASSSGTPMQTHNPCPSCGKENEADARFCNRCGTALTQPSTPPPPPREPTSPIPPPATATTAPTDAVASETSQIKDAVEKQWGTTQRDVETYKRELDMLGVRYKVGELSLEEYQRASEQLRAKIGALQPGAEELAAPPQAAISAKPFPRPWTRLVGMLGGLLLLVSVFLPWIAASELLGEGLSTDSGMDISPLVATLGIVGGLVVIGTAFLRSPRTRGKVRIIMGVLPLVAVLAIALIGVLPLLNEYARTLIVIREGFYLYVIAAGVLIVTGILERREST